MKKWSITRLFTNVPFQGLSQHVKDIFVLLFPRRQLVIEYVRYRAAFGANFHCTDCSSFRDLPAPSELFKLTFLSTSTAPGLPNLLAEMLRCYSEHDLFAAFNYLRDKKIMVGGSRVSSREWLISPCLPDEGVGEAEDLRTLKRKFDISEFHSGERAKKLKSSLAAEVILWICSKMGITIVGRFFQVKIQFIQSSRVNIGATAFPSDHIKEILYEGSNIPTAVAAAIQKAGDQGLSMEEVSKVMNIDGMQCGPDAWEFIQELIVEDVIINLMNILNPQVCSKYGN
ncbi:hypothetical protein RHGRI_024928 [Rhododendron griersonianum]|uniref:Uncharacterized protein n=1 Tax=Rhododendron griersonianum TaxID=479676 RepID=A0AAV6J993_9ERIC|nr:hypothetical protein RHGRI_024928 [Rhododendron griersonianum]